MAHKLHVGLANVTQVAALEDRRAMEVLQMGNICTVFGGFLDVAVHRVLRFTAASHLALQDALNHRRMPVRFAALCIVPDEDVPVALEDGVALDAGAGRNMIAVGNLHAHTRLVERPAVERAAQRIALDGTASGKVRTEMRTVRVQDGNFAGLRAENGELQAEAGDLLCLAAGNVPGVGNCEPSVGEDRRKVASAASPAHISRPLLQRLVPVRNVPNFMVVQDALHRREQQGVQAVHHEHDEEGETNATRKGVDDDFEEDFEGGGRLLKLGSSGRHQQVCQRLHCPVCQHRPVPNKHGAVGLANDARMGMRTCQPQ
eukprot:m.161042 g.161042  ORF g.161042 m.161042 type:complete len:316 (-) comp53035_c0_seq1:144-1091(-)